MSASEVVKVFTPIKRVPIVIGKAQNGQKLPFGPYTLPQIAGVAVILLITATLAMTLPANPAITFVIGLVFAVVIGFALSLIPYTGVRLTSRVFWIARLVLDPKPVSASGMPVAADSGRFTSFVEETVVVILPEEAAARSPAPDKAQGGVGAFLELLTRPRSAEAPPVTISAPIIRAEPRPPEASNWRAMTAGSGVNAEGGRERATNGAQS